MDSPDDAPNVRFYRRALQFLDRQTSEIQAEVIALATWLWFNPDVNGETKFLVPTPPGFHRLYIDDTYWLLYRLEGQPLELKVIDVGLVADTVPPDHI